MRLKSALRGVSLRLHPGHMLFPGRQCLQRTLASFATRAKAISELADAATSNWGGSPARDWNRYARKRYIPIEKRWEEFFKRPQDWWDQRHCKTHPRSADFVHQTKYHKLYLTDTKTDKEKLLGLQERLKKLDLSPAAEKPARLPTQEEAWQELFEYPWRFKDVRQRKLSEKHPDFKHTVLKYGVWLHSAPAWVEQHAEALNAAFIGDKPRLRILASDSDDEPLAPSVGCASPPVRTEEELKWDDEQQKQGVDVLMNSMEHDLVEEAIPPAAVFSGELMRHQKRGLAWMMSREADGAGPYFGMLCDQQGLGKTAQAMALIASNPCPEEQWVVETQSEEMSPETEQIDRRNSNSMASIADQASNESCSTESIARLEENNDIQSRATLVVLPKSLIKQWARELQEWTSLKVRIYSNGPSGKPCDMDELADCDVVLTTYHTILYASPTKTTRPKAPFHIKWWRIILDEAQAIKEHRGKTAAAVALLQVQDNGRRWVMTGTPLQNSPQELFSYFHFLRYKPFDEPAAFRQHFKAKGKDLAALVALLQAMLKAVMLRRTKNSQIDGVPILDLPPRKVALQEIRMSCDERAVYNKIESRMRDSFKEAPIDDPMQRRSAALTMIMELRRACNHPWLASSYSKELQGIEAPLTSDTAELRALQAQALTSAKLRTVIELLREHAVTEKIMVFSQWTSTLDILQDLVELEGWQYCRLDGSLTGDKRDAVVRHFKKDSDIHIFLVSLGAGKEGLNLAEASRIILVEPHFNPMNEEQAIDRAHRYGQTKPVHAHKLYIEGTIEERILELQRYKVQVSSAIIQQTEGPDVHDGQKLFRRQQFELEDLQYLLGMSAQPRLSTRPKTDDTETAPRLLISGSMPSWSANVPSKQSVYCH